VSKQVHLTISGLVQGVFFRASASQRARGLKLAGFVRNLSDGKVEIVAVGEEEALNKMIDWSHKGPLGAYVDHIEIQWSEPTGTFDRFQIR